MACPIKTHQKAVNDIQTAIDAGATHLSWYQLTIEPNTTFYRTPPQLPDEEIMAEIETLGQSVLTKHGFYNYEVSAWHGPNDAPCQHNLNYWQFGDYLAIGAGAHGKLTLKITQITKMAFIVIKNHVNLRIILRLKMHPKWSTLSVSLMTICRLNL